MVEEKISKLEANYEAMAAEIEKLKAKLAEKNETVWTPQKGEKYLCVYDNGRIVSQIYNPSSIFDIEIIDMNAKFKPVAGCKKHLEWYRDNVLRVQNKLMQLHELLCPDCFPDWDIGKETWTIYYDNTYKCFSYTLQCFCNFFVVCFTREAAEKACEILNKEKFMMEE